MKAKQIGTTPVTTPKTQGGPAAKETGKPSTGTAAKVLTTSDGTDDVKQRPSLGEQGLEQTVDRMKGLSKTSPVGEIASFKVDAYTTLHGKLDHRNVRMYGNEGEPGGHWMILETPIRVGGHEVKELYIDLDGPTGCGVGGGSKCGSCSLSSACSGTAIPNGGALTLNGRIEMFNYGGKDMPPGTYFTLSGVSNPNNHEPRYDGTSFLSSSTGQPLDVLKIVDQAKEDWPDNVVVLDTDRRLAHIGNIGGALPENTNPFNAYTAQRPIEMPGTAEKKALTFDARGRPSNAQTNKPLDSIASDREGRVWYLDRDTRTVWGVKDGQVSRLIRLQPGDLLGETRETPHGVWQGVDGRGGGHSSTPRDEWTDPTKVVTIPRRMDPDVQGTSLVKDKPVLWKGIVDQPDNSVTVEAFYAAMEARIVAEPGGPEMLKRIDAVITEAEDLYKKGVAAKPPLDRELWRRGMLQSYVHSLDLGIVMNAMGFDASGCAGKHDMTEDVPAKDLKWQQGRRAFEPWMDKYVDSLGENDRVNISFLNPHFAASMYKWGDSRMDADGLMDPHRLSPHHNGNSAEDVSWVEKALNFLAHHMPREHMGIRHQERGAWSNLEHALTTDPAIKNSEIGKTIARDAAKVWQMLEKEGKVTPWDKLKLPEGVPTPKLERSYEVLQGMNAGGDRLYALNLKNVKADLPGASQAVKDLAGELMSKMEAVDVSATETFSALWAAAQGGSDTDKKVATALGNALGARYAQRAPLSLENVERFMPEIAKVEAQMDKAKSDTFSVDEVRSALADMARFPEYAEKAKDGGDNSTWGTLLTWHGLWREGFAMVSVAK